MGQVFGYEAIGMFEGEKLVFVVEFAVWDKILGIFHMKIEKISGLIMIST